MGLTEELNELNRKAALLTKKQDDLKRLLAVEEHKVGELTASLKADGYDVDKMDEDQLTDLLETLTQTLATAKDKLAGNLQKAEALYSKFDGIK
jgi:uncharacterized membrane protein (Fun14 family)